MSEPSDDSPRNAIGLATVVLVAGIAFGFYISLVAYEFSYGKWGASLDDHSRRSVTLLIVVAVIFASALILVGAITYWSERLARHQPPQYPSHPP